LPSNDISHVAAVARDAYQGSPSIRTYVIGVGPSLDKLNAHRAGRRQRAGHHGRHPGSAEDHGLVLQALKQVRSQTLACDLDIPRPPGRDARSQSGERRLTSSGKYQVLGYDAACTGGVGWRYDDPGSPKKIVLCPTTCGAVQADRDGSLKLAFGCGTAAVIH